MRVALAELLQERSLSHPSRLVAVSIGAHDLRIRVVGHPWWSSHADQSEEHEIDFIFGGVKEGLFEPFDFDGEYREALSPFDLIKSAEIAWAQPADTTVYCNAPLPRPLDLYQAVHDYLAHCGSFRRASHYLNCSQSTLIEPFIRNTRSNSYLLGKFPPAIRDLVRAELERQQVAWSELAEVDDLPGKFLVTIQRSQFFCDTAEAVFGA